MATMIPGDVGEFKTTGERQFYRFMQQAAKPNSRPGRQQCAFRQDGSRLRTHIPVA